MDGLTRLVLMGAFLGLLLVVPDRADADCDGCKRAIKHCEKSLRIKYAKCKKSCRSTTSDRAQRDLCAADCGGVLDHETAICDDILQECGEECLHPTDRECSRRCEATLESCLLEVKTEIRECMKGQDGCVDVSRRNRRTCQSMERSAKRNCKQLVKAARGDCFHECAEGSAAKVHACSTEFVDCLIECRPACEGRFPECGGRCPLGLEGDTQVCETTEDGSACECVSTGMTFCGHSHPTCDGVCPPGTECGSVDEGLECGCVPSGNVPCGEAEPATCDGACPDGHSCQEAFGGCVCEERPGFECGELAGEPICAGECPAEAPICVGFDGDCECRDIPKPPPCSDIQVEGLEICGGECPEDRPVCRELEGECACTEVPEPRECGDAHSPTCHGLCPDGDVCIPDFDSPVVELSDLELLGCRCVDAQSLGCGEMFGPPLCFGECPDLTPICVHTDLGCECREKPEPVACGELSEPLLPGLPFCGGECPDERPLCLDLGEGCECMELPEPPPCGLISHEGLSFCGGECPDETPVCRDLGEGCACMELPEPPEPPPCGLISHEGFASCDGACPDELPVCREVEGMCTCTEPPMDVPCGRSGEAAICDGECEDGQECAEVEGDCICVS